MPRRPKETRQQILAAAQQRLLRQGAASLTLAAVAADAGVSKGGLLYHFPSKDALIQALVTSHLEAFEDRFRARLRGDRGGGARTGRAYLRATAEEDDPAAYAGLLAAVSESPELLAPLRERYRAWQRELRAEGDRAVLARLVADGLWLAALLDLAPPEPAQVDRILQLVEGLLSEEDT